MAVRYADRRRLQVRDLLPRHGAERRQPVHAARAVGVGQFDDEVPPAGRRDPESAGDPHGSRVADHAAGRAQRVHPGRHRRVQEGKLPVPRHTRGFASEAGERACGVADTQRALAKRLSGIRQVPPAGRTRPGQSPGAADERVLGERVRASGAAGAHRDLAEHPEAGHPRGAQPPGPGGDGELRPAVVEPGADQPGRARGGVHRLPGGEPAAARRPRRRRPGRQGAALRADDRGPRLRRKPERISRRKRRRDCHRFAELPHRLLGSRPYPQ